MCEIIHKKTNYINIKTNDKKSQDKKRSYFNVNFNIVFKTVTCALVGEYINLII